MWMGFVHDEIRNRAEFVEFSAVSCCSSFRDSEKAIIVTLLNYHLLIDRYLLSLRFIRLIHDNLRCNYITVSPSILRANGYDVALAEDATNKWLILDISINETSL